MVLHMCARVLEITVAKLEKMDGGETCERSGSDMDMGSECMN